MASSTETNEPLLPETNLVDLIAVRDQLPIKIDPYPSHVVDKVINVFKDGTTVVSERPHVIKDEKTKDPEPDTARKTVFE
ncbi:hypothetical protein G9A89_008429 [Geosiphon pyriformis]|nr:hypothetical protein G9A89_008429 [Geosiphon pyriformis]